MFISKLRGWVLKSGGDERCNFFDADIVPTSDKVISAQEFASASEVCELDNP
jgi:hypothetical protein